MDSWDTTFIVPYTTSSPTSNISVQRAPHTTPPSVVYMLAVGGEESPAQPSYRTFELHTPMWNSPWASPPKNIRAISPGKGRHGAPA